MTVFCVAKPNRSNNALIIFLIQCSFFLIFDSFLTLGAVSLFAHSLLIFAHFCSLFSHFCSFFAHSLLILLIFDSRRCSFPTPRKRLRIFSFFAHSMLIRCSFFSHSTQIFFPFRFNLKVFRQICRSDFARISSFFAHFSSFHAHFLLILSDSKASIAT